MSSTLAERTLQRATAALRSGPVACLPEIVKLLGTLSANSVEVSVTELADVIQKDPVILSKVIGAANTYGYNPTGVPVTTVTQAVHVIGYERIRTLAMSLVVGPKVDCVRKRAASPSLRGPQSLPEVLVRRTRFMLPLP